MEKLPLAHSEKAPYLLNDFGLILFIDEACPMCHWLGQKAVRWSRNIALAPLSGETARILVEPSLIASKHTVVLYSTAENRCYTEADAVAHLLMMGEHRWLGKLVLALKPLSTWMYRIVARLRPTRKDACPLPPAGVKFLP